MENLIVIAMLIGIIGAAVLYIRKEKKKGVRCIGCPDAGCCSAKGCGNSTENCNCGSHRDDPFVTTIAQCHEECPSGRA